MVKSKTPDPFIRTQVQRTWATRVAVSAPRKTFSKMPKSVRVPRFQRKPPHHIQYGAIALTPVFIPEISLDYQLLDIYQLNYTSFLLENISISSA
jgi:hypothetical protein